MTNGKLVHKYVYSNTSFSFLLHGNLEAYLSLLYVALYYVLASFSFADSKFQLLGVPPLFLGGGLGICCVVYSSQSFLYRLAPSVLRADDLLWGRCSELHS